MPLPNDLLPLIAVDVGNSRIKFGRFDSTVGRPLPEPTGIFDMAPDASLTPLLKWLPSESSEPFAWRIASVNRPGATRLVDWLRDQGVIDRTTLLASFDLPLSVGLERPDMVGIDRLLSAVAANHLRRPGQPAIVVDLGTAVTVDLISAAGEFLGGAILPGIGMSARALHHFTDLLPLIDLSDLGEPPPVLGESTVDAMTAGLYWGAIGGVRNLVQQYGQALGTEPLVILTGGAAPSVAHLICESAQYVPHLTLAGIAIAVAQ